MKVFKMFIDFDKEEAWLNQMAADGRLLTKAGLRYTFTPIEPGSAVVRVDYRESMNDADYADYLTLFADAGWHHAAGSRTSGAQYFASFAGNASADIFSDAASRAQRYRRSMGMAAAVMTPFLVIVVVLAVQGMLVPSQFYLTPGLWQRQGWEFIGAFLFETPFARLRTMPCVLVVVCVLLAVLVACQAVLYRRAIAGERTASG